MERRKFMITTAGALATLSVAGKALANDEAMTPEKPGKFDVTNQIGRNHGHGFNLGLEDLVVLMREANLNGEVVVDIQGQSNHPHSLNLSVDDIVMILAEGSLQKNSSSDANHSHPVLIEMKETAAPTEPTPS